MDALRDHRRNDLRHDLDGLRVRCNAKTDGHCDHRLRVGDRHHMDFRDVDDRNLDVSLCLHMSDLLGDHHDRKMDGNLDGNRDHHTNDLLVYRNLDDDHHGVLVDHHKNVTDDRNDLKMVVNHVSRNYVLPDQKMDAMTDGNLCHRMNDLLVGQNLGVNRDHHTNDLLGDHLMDDDYHDALVGHRKNGMDDLNLDVKTGENRDRRMNDLLDDLKTDGNHVNRNYAPRDLKMDANLDAMNHHVKSMVYLSMSCDRMSRDHLRCGHLKMHRHDTNRMDGKNLDGKMKIHHVSWC